MLFSGGRSRKNIAVYVGVHHMKNKNIVDVFCQLNLISKKAPMQKNANNYLTLKIFSLLVSLTRYFTKFIFLKQLTAMPQFNMQNTFFFFCFFLWLFLSSHHDTNPLLHLYHFRKKYNYILANINSEPSRVIFSFFVFIQWVKHFCTPANFVSK